MLKIIELFAGIGSQTKALQRLGVEHEVVAISEINSYAFRSYEAIHGAVNNMGDITKIEKLPYADLWTYSYPCQSISVAGKQEGFEKDSGTRSSLLWEVERLLTVAKLNNELPKYLLLENVKNLVSKKFKPQFDEWIKILDDFGYNTYWKVLNAKHFGIPQSRERVFGVSIRKDIDDKTFKFPEPFDNGLRLKDFLESNVDEKYYISKDKTEKLIESLKNKTISNTIRASGRSSLDRHQWDNVCINTKMQDTQVREDGVCCTLTSSMYKEPPMTLINVGNVNPSENGMNGNVYSEEGLAPTITTNKGEGSKILTNNSIIDTRQHIDGVRLYNDICPTITGTDYKEPKLIAQTNKCDCVGRLENVKGHDYLKRVYSADGCCPTIPTVTGGGHEPKILEDFYANREVREYDECPTLRADRQGLKVIEGVMHNRKGTPKLVDICNTLTAQDPSRTLGNYTPVVSVLESNELKFVGGIKTGDTWIDDGKELSRNYRSGNRVYDAKGIAVAQTSDDGGLAGCTGIYAVNEVEKVNGCSLRTRNYIDQPQQKEIRNDELSNSITTVTKDAMACEEPSILKYERNEYGKEIRKKYESGEIQEKMGNMRDLNPRKDGITNTITTVQKDNLLYEPQYRMRKLTEIESWKLMGFDKEDVLKCKAIGISNSQLYKQAGNSIVVNVLEKIFENLFCN